MMGFSSGISEPIPHKRLEYDPDEAYERSLLDDDADDPCIVDSEPEGWPDR